HPINCAHLSTHLPEDATLDRKVLHEIANGEKCHAADAPIAAAIGVCGFARRSGSAARWQRDVWPPPSWYSGGCSLAQRSHAYWQRSRKRHPSGQLVGGGTVPGIVASRSAVPPTRGIAPRSPSVYGW